MTAPASPPTQPTVEEVVRELGSEAKWLRNAALDMNNVHHVHTCEQAANAIDRAIAILPSDAKDAARYRFAKRHGWPRRVCYSSTLWYMDRAADNVEVVRDSFEGCLDAAMEPAGAVDTAIDLARGAT